MVTPELAPSSTSGKKASRKGLILQLVKLIFAIAVVVIVLFAIAVLNNNYSISRPSRAEFNAQLDRAIDTSTDWIVKHPDIQGNWPLMFMLSDMAQMSGDPRLHQYLQSYLASDRVRIPGQPETWYWAHWADPSLPVPAIPLSRIPYLSWQNRWFTYGTAPDRVPLTEADRGDMFSPTKYSWGTRLHLQLISLDIFLHFNTPTPEQKSAINAVTEGVARDAFWDFRVSDSYEQRSAFILAAGRPDLIRSRWIERILANQQPDGAWNYCWYGWCRGVAEFRFGDDAKGDQGHSTVQAAWALYQLKYKYTDWINQNFK